MKSMNRMALIAGLAAGTTWAGPLDVTQVAGDAPFVAHVDVDALKNSRIGNFILGELSKDSEAVNGLAALDAMFHFDVTEDLKGLTLVGMGANPDDAVLMVKAKVDGPHLVTLLKANKTYTSDEAHGHTVHSWVDDKKSKRTYGVILDKGGVLVGGNKASVKAQLKVLGGAAPNLKNANRHNIEAESGTPMVQLSIDMEQLDGLEAEAEVIQQARRVTMRMDEKGDNMAASVGLVTGSESDAMDLGDVLQGLISFARLNRDEEPELARMARMLKATVDGAAVQIHMEVPTEELINMAKEKGLK